MPGETATIGDVLPAGVACPATSEKLGEMLKAVEVHDNDGYQESLQGGSALHKGDRVRVLERKGFAGLNIRLRILSGPFAHSACWTEADIPKLFR